ncbi:uncharacterized protein LOC131163487 [Malania oleifera]|uniref:uncharacterized protein LOC131163487 n=1 Tax=Malania oleifera TaxID=397392 RepID=UPI0025AE7E5F|nr:uncharacterized protein LOC131163487 [Malania oleifera]
MNPPVFSGATDPVVAENWLQEVEKILTVHHYIDEQRVLCTTYRLVGEVERRWTTIRLLEEQRTTPVLMTWARFGEMFFDGYYSASVREARVQEFLSLSQGSITVQQYTVRLIELSRFCPYIVLDEVKKARMFERNLRRDIYRQVVVLRIQDFVELVNRAIIAEESLPRETETQSQRKRTAPSSFHTGPS